MYLLQKNPADAKYAPRAAARGTALRAVKVVTFCQILPEPLLDANLPHPRVDKTKQHRHAEVSRAKMQID